jgi:hypothetical protein
LSRSDGPGGARALLGLVALTALSYPLGLAIGSRFVLPLLNTAPAYALMAACLRAGDRRGALRVTLVWALALAVCGTTTFAFWPSDPGPLVLHGPEYRDEMFHWIRTGQGSEGDVRLFLPQHVLHLAAFLVLSLLTASLVSITMGAVLMNYMAYYVASLDRAGAPTWAVVLLGWQPWAIARVAAFCAFGTVLAEPLLARALGYARPGWRAWRTVIVAASAGILADWVLKTALAPDWGVSLRAVLP